MARERVAQGLSFRRHRIILASHFEPQGFLQLIDEGDLTFDRIGNESDGGRDVNRDRSILGPDDVDGRAVGPMNLPDEINCYLGA